MSPPASVVQAQAQPQVIMVPTAAPMAQAQPAATDPSLVEAQIQLQREQLELQTRQMQLNEARAQRYEDRDGGLMERLENNSALMRFARMFGIGR